MRPSVISAKPIYISCFIFLNRAESCVMVAAFDGKSIISFVYYDDGYVQVVSTLSRAVDEIAAKNTVEYSGFFSISGYLVFKTTDMIFTSRPSNIPLQRIDSVIGMHNPGQVSLIDLLFHSAI